MPSSDWHAIPAIIDLVVEAQPRSILDIGVGFGKYGFLCREYTDVWQRRYWPGQWKVRIDGIEAYGAYIDRWQRALYDTIHIGPLAEVLPTLGVYDLILFIDVLEHLEREAGERTLDLIAQRCDRAIVTTPVRMSPQEAVFGNPYERHATQWTPEELGRYGHVLQLGNTLLLGLRKGA